MRRLSATRPPGPPPSCTISIAGLRSGTSLLRCFVAPRSLGMSWSRLRGFWGWRGFGSIRRDWWMACWNSIRAIAWSCWDGRRVVRCGSPPWVLSWSPGSRSRPRLTPGCRGCAAIWWWRWAWCGWGSSLPTCYSHLGYQLTPSLDCFPFLASYSWRDCFWCARWCSCGSAWGSGWPKLLFPILRWASRWSLTSWVCCSPSGTSPPHTCAASARPWFARRPRWCGPSFPSPAQTCPAPLTAPCPCGEACNWWTGLSPPSRSRSSAECRRWAWPLRAWSIPRGRARCRLRRSWKGWRVWSFSFVRCYSWSRRTCRSCGGCAWWSSRSSSWWRCQSWIWCKLPPRKLFRNHRPFVPVALVQLEETLLLRLAPPALLDAGVQVVVPSPYAPKYL